MKGQSLYYHALVILVLVMTIGRRMSFRGVSRGNPIIKSNLRLVIMKQPAVYIMTNKRNGTLYTGVTSNLVQRIFQHKNNMIKGFTNRYNCKMLVYYELL